MYELGLVFFRRHADVIGLVSALGYLVACAVSVLAGGSSLPLKLHEAAITAVIGIVLLAAAAISRPLPLRRLLKTPDATRQQERALKVLAGTILVLHALVHVLLAGEPLMTRESPAPMALPGTCQLTSWAAS